jgi:WD40 repeat protein
LNWTKLGDKSSLQLEIHRITAIPLAIVNGALLSDYSIEERLQWGSVRQTKLEEDRVYSMEGFFGIDLAPIYGIGYQEAFRRLQEEIKLSSACIRDLYVTDTRDDKHRIQQTKGGLIEDASHWVYDTPEYRKWFKAELGSVLWIKGDPGKGKTMLICSIIDDLQSRKGKADILAYFFCQATDTRINNATAVLRGLLCSIFEQQPSLVSHLRTRYSRAGGRIFEDSNAWIVLTGVFSKIISDPLLPTMYILIDALDECDTNLRELMQFISLASNSASRVRWVLSSRNWPLIQDGLANTNRKLRLSLELNGESIAAAVRSFIHCKVNQLATKHGYDAQVQETIIEYVSINAQDTFLWVALLFNTLKNIPKRHVLQKLKAVPAGLDALYDRMLQQIWTGNDAQLCMQVMAIIGKVHRPITIHELSTLLTTDLDLSIDELAEVVGLCGSFLTLRDDKLYYIHQSAVEFVVAQASNLVLPLGLSSVNCMILSRCLESMEVLRQDFYALNDPGYKSSDFEVQGLDPDPLLGLYYSCEYWLLHVLDLDLETERNLLHEDGIIHRFWKSKWLYWLEIISLHGDMLKVFRSLTALASRIEVWQSDCLDRTDTNCKQAKGDLAWLNDFVQDAKRFVLYHHHAILMGPLQIYASALLFSPSQSLTRRSFAKDLPSWVTTQNGNVSPAKWPSSIYVLEHHRYPVNSVQFSHDMSLLLTTCSKVTNVWDTSTGLRLEAFEGDFFTYSIFLSNTHLIAILSSNLSVQVIDEQQCFVLESPKSMRDESKIAHWLTSSNDSSLVAAVRHNVIVVWKLETSKCLCVLESHALFIDLIFVKNNYQLMSADTDGTISIWDISSGHCLQRLSCIDPAPFELSPLQVPNVPGHRLMCGEFLGDAKHLICATPNSILRHEIETSTSIKLNNEGTSYGLWVSSDSTRYAWLEDQNSVQVADAQTGIVLQKIACQSKEVRTLNFSRDSRWLAIGGNDGVVTVHDLSVTEVSSTKSHSYFEEPIAWSPNALYLAVAKESTIEITHTNSDKVHILQGHAEKVSCFDFRQSATMQLISGSRDGAIKVWDLNTYTCTQNLLGHESPVICLASCQGQGTLISISVDATIKIWDLALGQSIRNLRWNGNISKDVDKFPSAVALSPDATRLAVAFGGNSLRVWNLVENAITFELRTPNTTSVAFSMDSTQLAISSKEGIVILDIKSEQCLMHVSHDAYMVDKMSFDDTGHFLTTNIGCIDVRATVQDSVGTNAIFTGLSAHEHLPLIHLDSKPLLYIHIDHWAALGSPNMQILDNSVAIRDCDGRLEIYKFDIEKLRALKGSSSRIGLTS